MRQALLVALVLGSVVTGCSSDGETAAPSPTDKAARTSAPAAAGPTAGPTIPVGAFVAPVDLGPAWTVHAPVATPCAPANSRSAIRSTGLAEARGLLTETLATGVDVAAAVTAWQRSLRACGFTVRDQPLGDAGLTAYKQGVAFAVTGTEGVLVVLHATGALADAQDELDGWADLALGTSCVAAPDGCH